MKTRKEVKETLEQLDKALINKNNDDIFFCLDCKKQINNYTKKGKHCKSNHYIVRYIPYEFTDAEGAAYALEWVLNEK